MTAPRLGLGVCAGLLLAALPAFGETGPAPRVDPATADAAPAGSRGQRPAEEGTEATSPAAEAEGAAPAGPQDTAPSPAPGDPERRGIAGGAALAAPIEVPRQFPFVTLDQAEFFAATLYGQRLNAVLEERQAELARENREIEADLAQKEQALTARRATLPPEQFRGLADAFNAEVERHRSEQAAKERGIYQLHERDRALFQDLANQALVGLLRERGALAIIAEEAIVLGFRDIDITEDAVARLDALVGDGSSLPQPGSEAGGAVSAPFGGSGAAENGTTPGGAAPETGTTEPTDPAAGSQTAPSGEVGGNPRPDQTSD